MLQVAADIGKKVKANGRAESDAAVTAMVKRGLKVQKVTPEIEVEWRALLEKLDNQIRGKVVPPEVFDLAHSVLKEYRAGHANAK